MKASKLSDAQIAFIPMQADNGAATGGFGRAAVDHHRRSGSWRLFNGRRFSTQPRSVRAAGGAVHGSRRSG
jgi:hypothetical protein